MNKHISSRSFARGKLYQWITKGPGRWGVEMNVNPLSRNGSHGSSAKASCGEGRCDCLKGVSVFKAFSSTKLQVGCKAWQRYFHYHTYHIYIKSKGFSQDYVKIKATNDVKEGCPIQHGHIYLDVLCWLLNNITFISDPKSYKWVGGLLTTYLNTGWYPEIPRIRPNIVVLHACNWFKEIPSCEAGKWRSCFFTHSQWILTHDSK